MSNDSNEVASAKSIRRLLVKMNQTMHGEIVAAGLCNLATPLSVMEEDPCCTDFHREQLREVIRRIRSIADALAGKVRS
jgi:hypothetical protein